MLLTYPTSDRETQEEVMVVAKNTGRGFRRGAVTNRSQVRNPKTKDWTKRDADTGRFVDRKSDSSPFKGVRKEK